MPVPTDLSKLSNVVKNDVVKKTVYNKLVAKVDHIDTSDFVLKIKYSTGKAELENNIPDASGLVKKTNYNAKIDIVCVKRNACRIHFWYMNKHKRKRKRKAINLMTNSNLIDKKGIL